MSDSFEDKYKRALSATALIVNDEMLEQARGNKMIAVFVMPAMDFLKLTSSKEMPPEHFVKESKSLADYNKYVSTGETIIMPFLKVEQGTGRVKGHEGRHRAGALIKELGPDVKMKVAISVSSRDGITRYYTEVRDPKTYIAKKTFLGVDDVPIELRGEFRPEVSVTLSGRGATELWK
jgi:hypothetical protein